MSCQRDNLKELANELGINVECLYKWRKAAKREGIIPSENEITGTKTTIDTQEVKQLKKELKEARLELEILKKAVYIFSKSGGNSTNL